MVLSNKANTTFKDQPKTAQFNGMLMPAVPPFTGWACFAARLIKHSKPLESRTWLNGNQSGADKKNEHPHNERPGGILCPERR